MDPVPIYVTKKDSCTITSMKERAIEAAIRAGHVRAFKVGKKILIERNSLLKWIEVNEITPVDRHVTRSALQTLMDQAVRHARKKGL